jgi:hypothetical protein
MKKKIISLALDALQFEFIVNSESRQANRLNDPVKCVGGQGDR